MLKKLLIFFICTCFTGTIFVGNSFSDDTGPAEIQLTSEGSSKKPPAVFPHKQHQDSLTCGECHHDIEDGKQVPYTEGQKIQKCVTCHNSEVLPGKKRGKNKLDSFKGAAHENCLKCHKDVAKKDPAKKNLKSCKNCHQK